MTANILADARVYVLYWLSTKGITISERGELMEPALARASHEIFDSMWLDYISQARAYNAAEAQKIVAQRASIKPVNEADMRKALAELITKEKATHRQTCINNLRCQAENLNPIEVFLNALTGQVDQVEVAALAHWVWSVKRKMQGQDVTHHLMPIFRGPQGSGKSTAATKLFEPLNIYKIKLSFGQMQDDRYSKTLSENYICFLDELQGVERAEMSAIKRLLTAETIDYRPLRTNEVLSIRQACSFIGCTNVPVSELMNDRTGMRRFLEIETLDRADWESINGIDFVELWRGVDETKAEGYITPYLTQLNERQQELVTQDEVTLFIEEHNLIPTNERIVEVSASHLFDIYRDWCEQNGYRLMDARWFGRKLSNRGLKSKQKKTAGKNVNVYLVNVDAPVGTTPFRVLRQEPDESVN